MSQGYLQSGQIILWTNKPHKISLKPKNNSKDFIIAENCLGGANVNGMICQKCRKIVIDY